MKLKEILRPDILESLTTRADVKWKLENLRGQTVERGYFQIGDEEYRTNIEHNEINLTNRVLNVIHVSFSRMIGGGPVVSQTDSKHPNKVFGAVMNSILDKIKEIRPQIVLFTAKFESDTNKRGKPDLKIFNQRAGLYKSLQYHAARISGYNEIIDPLIGKTGHHFALINQHVNISKEELRYIKNSI